MLSREPAQQRIHLRDVRDAEVARVAGAGRHARELVRVMGEPVGAQRAPRVHGAVEELRPPGAISPISTRARGSARLTAV
ncbi:MAG TPA: hypothetical protein VIM22_01600 [Solirubrobacteraceae bacterium]